MINPTTVAIFIDELRKDGYSADTIRAYESDLSQAMTYLHRVGGAIDWTSTEALLAQWVNTMRSSWAPATTQRRLSVLRAFAKRQGYALLVGYRAPKPAQPEPHPIAEGIDGVKRMIASVNPGKKAPVYRALLAMNGLMGMRVSECRSIRASHFDLENMVLKFRGKGDKARVVPISEVAWNALKFRYRLCAVTGDLLVPMSDRAARDAVSRHGRRAGLINHVASHGLRATLATAALEKTKDLRAVQEILGHASPNTTQRYTGVKLASMREAVDL